MKSRVTTWNELVQHKMNIANLDHGRTCFYCAFIILTVPSRMAKIFELVFPQEVTSPTIARTLACLLRPLLSPILSLHKDGNGGGGETMDWKHLLAYITGTVDQELLLRNEYLVTENRILRHQITGRVHLE